MVFETEYNPVFGTHVNDIEKVNYNCTSAIIFLSEIMAQAGSW